MPHNIQAISTDHSGLACVIDKYPDFCPVCHTAVEVKPLGTMILRKDADEHDYVEMVFRCPRQDCDHFFIARYKSIGGTGAPRPELALCDVVPRTPLDPQFPDTIEKMSPRFVRIYTQASEAASRQLDEIAGVGYRKALEFLIKDYLIHSTDDEEQQDKYKQTALANCIKDHVSDPKVKLCASRAVWLGNDETHYERKWNDQDLRDLKILLQLATNWIDSELLTQHYGETMPPK